MLSRFLPRGRFARGTTLLAGSNALGQVLALAASPLLTRLYTPADFGILSVYMSITTVLGVVLALRYEYAIALPTSEREASVVVVAGLGFVLLTSALGLGIVLGFREWIALALNTPALEPLLLVLPAGMLMLGAFTVFRFWCIRVGAFAPIGKARLLQVVSSLFVQIAGSAFGAAALIGGQLANQGAGSLSLGRRTFARADVAGLRWSELKRVIVRYRRFPLISSWAALLNRCSAEMPAVLFAVYFGPATAGLYALATRVLNTPTAVLTNAIASVFLSAAAERAREGRLAELVEQLYGRLTMVILPPMALIALVSPDVFRIVFGDEWAEAGHFAQWLAVLVYFSTVAAPLTMLFSVLERQSEELAYQVLLFVARGLSIVVGARVGDATLCIALFALASGLCNLVFLVWVAIRAGTGIHAMAVPTLRSLALAVAFCVPAGIGVHVTGGPVAWGAGVTVSTIAIGVHAVSLLRRRGMPD